MAENKRIFDTAVQKLKYDVLKAIIRNEYEHCYENIYIDIPKEISPGPKATMRCCIFKERAIVQERIKLALGGDKNNPNVVEVIDIACDECPIGGIFVTPACRGCIVHRCQEVCPRDAIQIIDHKAVVDKTKCIECGKCTQACPYGAIIAQKRPCVNSCKVKAITVGEDKKAVIDNNKCISCGACVYQCPFGAIVDKSLIMECIDILKKSENNTNYHVYAVIAPSIVSQFKYAKIEQVVTGIRKLGFHQVVEAALGADITLYHEAEEWKEKGILTTSCCPSFVMFVEKNFPELAKYVSHSVSPDGGGGHAHQAHRPEGQGHLHRPVREQEGWSSNCPKRRAPSTACSPLKNCRRSWTPATSRSASLEETSLDNASFYGRIFAKSGGIAQGVADVAKEMGVEGIKPLAMNGIDECRAALMKLKFNRATENFFRGHGVRRRLPQRPALPQPRPQKRGGCGQVRRFRQREEDRQLRQAL